MSHVCGVCAVCAYVCVCASFDLVCVCVYARHAKGGLGCLYVYALCGRLYVSSLSQSMSAHVLVREGVCMQAAVR